MTTALSFKLMTAFLCQILQLTGRLTVLYQLLNSLQTILFLGEPL